MRTTLDLDETLLKQALEMSGARTKTEAIERGLTLLIQRAAFQRLREARGKDPNIAEVPRRRFK